MKFKKTFTFHCRDCHKVLGKIRIDYEDENILMNIHNESRCGVCSAKLTVQKLKESQKKNE